MLLGIIGIKKYADNQKDRADRMTENYSKLEDNNKQLELTYKELNDRQLETITRLSDSLDIKPKTIEKIVTVTVIDSIPYPVETFVEKIDSNTYKFKRDTGCFKIRGRVFILDSIPNVIIDKLEYNNVIDYVVYLQRKQWELWFIKSRLFGRKEAELEIITKCGESTVEEVKLIKK
jgi:hypothetical protein